MNSTLKILVDMPCEVYCDYELKGEATPQSIFKMDLRKGTYILEFKHNGNTLFSQEYIMKTNDEDDLLRVSLLEVAHQLELEEKTKQVERLNVCVVFHDYKYWIKNLDDKTEKEIAYKLEEDPYTLPKFDTSGLLPVFIDVLGADGVAQEGRLFGCINKLGEVQIPFNFDYVNSFYNPHFTIAVLKDQPLFINKWGKIVFENKYSPVSRYNRGDGRNLFVVEKNNKKGVINEKGEFVVPLSYDNIEEDLLLKGYILTEKSKMGFCGFDGSMIIPLIYDEIKEVVDGLLYAKIGDKCCVIKDSGEMVIPMVYEDIEYGYWNPHGFIVTKKGKKGFLGLDGSVILPLEFDNIKINLRELIVTQKEKKGLYKIDGTCLLPLLYDDIKTYPSEFDLLVKKDGIWQVYTSINGNFHFLHETFNDYEVGFYDQLIVKVEGHYKVYNYRKDNYLSFDDLGDEFDGIDYNEFDCYYCVHKYGKIRLYDKEGHAIPTTDAFSVDEKVGSRPITKKYYLFFDTETTGTPLDYKAPSSDIRNWPRLVQLGWILMDENGEKVSEKSYMVKPQGFIIPYSATDFHKITTAMAVEQGHDLSYVLDEFIKDYNKAEYIVGHNIEFDKKVVGAELIRKSRPDVMDSKKSYCTMESSVEFCKIPGHRGYKYPKLQELYAKLFGHVFEGAHNAVSDINATQQCFWEMRRRKLI